MCCTLFVTNRIEVLSSPFQPMYVVRYEGETLQREREGNVVLLDHYSQVNINWVFIWVKRITKLSEALDDFI